ncbi:hypothetical protein [Pectinatus sottacetonis]|uniref:hypothetical protein n=1 Tax=Pectinatus sottacetonis TaxID=1002795 RepID=UPI0018C777A4|nr:hypothetical protein [Pectinatus sottacetonis]
MAKLHKQIIYVIPDNFKHNSVITYIRTVVITGIACGDNVRRAFCATVCETGIQRL